MSDHGHVFVVNGRLENLDHDAVVIPTDAAFTLEPYWAPVLGLSARDDRRRAADDLRPVDWAERRWGRARSSRAAGRRGGPTWFLDVARDSDRSADAEGAVQDLMGRLAELLADVAAADVRPAHGRPLPLLAIPTLGVGKGGFADRRGHLIDRLLATCQDAVSELALDVVLVAANPADHAAFQTRRRAMGSSHPMLDERESRAARALAEDVHEGTLALVLGAGVSMSAGLPSWGGLLAELAAEAGVRDFDGLDSVLDQAELLRLKLGDDVGAAVARIVAQADRYGLNHALLAALECRHVVTTNYDQLYERAVGDHRHDPPLRVLPHDPAPPRAPWLLKMHGDVDHPGSIVLSRSDFVGYSARSGPMGAVVQSLMLTERLLVVGSSMTDDNVLRLAHEVLAFRSGDHPLATVLTFGVEPAMQELWRGRFEFLTLGTPAPEGERPEERRRRGGQNARRLAIFLDALAMFATRPRHVLDERYTELLGADARTVAGHAQQLAAELGSLPDDQAEPFSELRALLDELGAG